MPFTQSPYNIRCEWGLNGAHLLAPLCDALIIIDVLSFTTAVSIATSRGAIVYPYPFNDDSRIPFARSVNALLAGPRNQSQYSLSPASLTTIPPNTRLVLPSPNGSTISLSTGHASTFAGCLRNAQAVARAASGVGPRIGLIPAGERFKSDSTLRPAIEDLLGAGAIISHLPGTRSPEANAALSVFTSCQPHLLHTLRACSSGQELLAHGYDKDIALAADLNADTVAPLLANRAYAAADPNLCT
jgi:2-phosphosulfolactate phosphatase